MPVRTGPRQRETRDDTPQPRPVLGARGLVLVVNGVIASVGGVFAVTQSVEATAIAGGVGVILAGWLASIRR